MPTGNAKFEAAAAEAACQFLTAAGSGAATFTAYSLLTGQLWAGAGGAAVTGIAAYAYAQNCQWDTTGGLYPTEVTLPCCPPNDETGDKSKQWKYRFWRVSQQVWNEIEIGYSYDNSGQYISGLIEQPGAPGEDGRWRLTPCGISYDRSGFIPANLFNPANFTDLHIVPPTGTGCDVPPPQPPGPYTYTDPDDGCQITVTFEGWAVDGGGSFGAVWRMDPILPSARAGGGIIGGCNFNPVVIYQPPGGPPVPPIPVPPDPVPGPDGKPWWLAPLLSLLGGTTGAVIGDALNELFETEYPAGNRTIYAACEYKEDGTPEEFTVNYPAENYQERVLTALNAIVDFQQQILLWKTPTCSGGGSSVSGDPVSINWVSDEYSTAGNDRIRKLLTYFDQVGTSLEDTVTHWKDFSWQAGPVIVSVNGVPLGKPQVWAASVEEGKRVINHAAAIAGVDMTKAEWLITSPRSSRYGMAGVMRVAKGRSGQLSITKRDGPSGLPEVLTPTPSHGSG